MEFSNMSSDIFTIWKNHENFEYLNMKESLNDNKYKTRTVLIDKILSIKNKDFLEALDRLVSSSK